MADKSILQLLAASVLNLTDTGVIVQGTETEQFQLQLLIDLLSANVNLGANITFGTTVPTGGRVGDFYVKTDTNQFYQNIGGTWTVIYTVASSTGTNIIYAVGVPSAGTGNNGDTYVDTGIGIFYQKSAGTWVQKYSIATGPQGPQGTAGTNGTNGIDGNAVLYGNHNPSNMSDGVDGNFYLNTANYTLFGPKAGGVWPAGVSIIGPAGTTVTPTRVTYSRGTALPIVLTTFQTSYSIYGQAPKFNTRKVTGGFLTATISTNTTSASNGTYTAQAIVATSGVGTGGAATFIVLAGLVTSVVKTTSGTGFTVGDTFTCAATPGAIYTISTLNNIVYLDITNQATIIITEITDLLPDSVSINVDDDGTGHLNDNIQLIISL